MSLIWETAVGVGADRLLNLAEKQGWLNRLLYVFKKKHNVLVLGTTGAGKTNLIESLTEFMPDAIDFMNRTEVMKNHRVSIDNHPFVFLDTPGQEFHKSRRIDAIREAMTKDIAFVINVVANGYHEYRKDTSDVFLNDGSINKEYLLRHRQIELDAVSEWSSLLGSKRTAGGLLSVVTKADLWWKVDSWEEVLGYYEKGEYYSALGDAVNLDPIVLPYCSVFHKFYGSGNLSGEFDERDRLNYRINLLNTMLAFVGKGK